VAVLTDNTEVGVGLGKVEITSHIFLAVVYPEIFFFRGCPTNSVEDRRHKKRGSWGGSPLVRGSAQFASE
jgi:hypothetical protein